MTNADREEFALKITALAAARRVDLSEAVIEGLWQGLEDLSVEEFSGAVATAIRQGGRGMPMANELRELAGHQPLDARAIRAWTALRRAIREHGAYHTVDFDDPAINATVRSLGGWPRLCGTESEEMDRYIRRDFERLYQTFAKHGVTSIEAGPLRGLFAADTHTVGDAPHRVLTGLAERPSMRLNLAPRPEGAPQALVAALAQEKSASELDRGR